MINNSIIISHNSKLRCWLINLNPIYFNNIFEKYKTYNIKLKNCAIIKVEIIKKNNYATISLIYDGFNKKSNNSEIKYYTNNNNLTEDVLFESFKIPISKLNLNDLDLIENVYNFYLIRHAQASHNINKQINQLDPTLTQEGIKQSKELGIYLSQFFSIFTNNYFFISKLRRTKQTLEYILNELKLPISKVKIIVLPCSQETKYINGKCVDRFIIKNSNQMICDLNNLSQNSCSNINHYPIIWDYYINFNNYNYNCNNLNIIKLTYLFF